MKHITGLFLFCFTFLSSNTFKRVVGELCLNKYVLFFYIVGEMHVIAILRIITLTYTNYKIN